MKVLNIHKRMISQPPSVMAELLQTLASRHDRMLATDKWPGMRLDKGLQPGSKGGHGPIRYHVIDYHADASITFRFDMPGFDGTHRFQFEPADAGATELTHIIDMETSGMATLKWALAIRWLHDAYIEDAFDKVENQFTDKPRTSKWTIWVKVLRFILR